MRILAISVLALLGLAPPLLPVQAGELRIAAWNLEHLDDSEGGGCIGRSAADYEALAGRIVELDADVVAFQEVQNVAAARRVFPEADWHVETSSRPPARKTRPCWDRPEEMLGHLGTGFAVRRGVVYRRHDDLEALGLGTPFQRWGTDISVAAGGRELRLLSVHLRTGCWGARQDGENRRKTACMALREQVAHLRAWADARRTEGTAFAILGDFNRRLALPGDWAWAMLSSGGDALRLLTADKVARCDPRYPAFIDHLVAGGGAEEMAMPGSFRELPRRGAHPDHCAVSAVFGMGG